MRRSATLLLLCLFAAPALAQTPGNCDLGTAERDLDHSDVRARLFNQGNLFWDGGGAHYEVPRGGGVHALFASAVWIGGMVDGELRMSANTYAQGGDRELWPGPLDEQGNPPEDCAPYDRIWKVNVDDLEAYEQSGETTPDLLDWPVALGAPGVDGDGIEGSYDLEAGDRPGIYGTETAFWVMNDAGNVHEETESAPMGMEVRVTAFGLASEDPVFDQATFYRYELVYRGGAPLEEAYFSLWTDTDLGSSWDDLIGTDSTRSLLFAYNEDNDDEADEGGYGENPPAVGVDMLQGAGSSMHWFNTHPPTTNPDNAEGYYHYMQAQWLDGSPLTEGNNGYDESGPSVPFVFPGDPVEPAFWSARCPDPGCTEPPLTPTDQRAMILSTPAFTLQPGETKTVDLAIVFARGADHLDSVTELKAASDVVQDAYDDGSLFDIRFPVASDESAGTPAAMRLGAVYPNPVRGEATLTYHVREAGPVRLAAYDVLGRAVAILHDGPQTAGEHRARFEAGGLASGVYLVVLEAGGERHTRKVLLVR